MKLLLATAFTRDYARAAVYMDTLQRNCNVPFKLLVIGEDMHDYGMPNSIVQAGHFLNHIPECDTVIFTDADIKMHRPMDEDELEFLYALQPGQITACPNKHLYQLFAEETPMLFQRKEFTGYDDVRVFNTGFVAARTETYRALFRKFDELWKEFDEAFGHYAKIQLCMCAAAHRLGLEWIPTPYHLCSQGHFGCPEGLNPHVNPPEYNGRIICFDHRISH